MRTLVTLLGLALAAALSFRGQFLIPRSGVEKDFVQVEAHGAMSISYAQVLLRVTNNQISPIFIPVCSADSYEVCDYFGYLEQRKPTDLQNWRRTRTKTQAADILLPSSVLAIAKGETYGLVFRFYPGDEVFTDGSRLQYPGTVRVVIFAWPDKKSIGDQARAIQFRTQEFEIPPPQETWGAQSAP